MNNINCRHCARMCKTLGTKSCNNYTPIANKPEQLRVEIKEAYSKNEYDKARKLQEELFRLENG